MPVAAPRLAHPLWLAGLSLVLVAGSYVCYRYSGSDLMPEMDEGGFTLDYCTPAGSFARGNQPHGAATSNRFCNTVPEVESTSRRTGLELGLAAVTEANRGDIPVKLKTGSQPRPSTTSSKTCGQK